MPLSRFGGANLSRIRGVRFSFHDNPSGKLYLSSVRATHSMFGGAPEKPRALASTAPVPPLQTGGAAPLPRARRISSGNAVSSIRSSADGESVEIALTASTPFQVKDDLLILSVGSQETALSRHSGGNLREVVFKLSRAAFDAAANGDPVRVGYRRGTGDVWDFGTLNKSRLDR
jgi:hypothetical protein